MYEFWYDYIKPKYGDKAKLCQFVALRAKTYLLLINGCNDDDYDKNKIINNKAKEQKSV